MTLEIEQETDYINPLNEKLRKAFRELIKVQMLDLLNNERATICKYVARDGQLFAPEDLEKLEKAYITFDILWEEINLI